jgi:hypothetical protein
MIDDDVEAARAVSDKVKALAAEHAAALAAARKIKADLDQAVKTSSVILIVQLSKQYDRALCAVADAQDKWDEALLELERVGREHWD